MGEGPAKGEDTELTRVGRDPVVGYWGVVLSDDKLAMLSLLLKSDISIESFGSL